MVSSHEGSYRPGPKAEVAAGDAVLRASLPAYRLGELLLAIAQRELTGRLRLIADVGERTIYFHTGFPVFSQSSQFSERLGALGVRQGLLTRDHVARALSYARAHDAGIGEALLEQGMLNPRQLYGLLGVQLRDVLVACCATPLRARFAVEPSAVRYAMVLRMHPMSAMLGAALALPEAERSDLLVTLGPRALQQEPLPQLVAGWLEQVGVAGSIRRICRGAEDVESLRQRLAARMSPAVEKRFEVSGMNASLVPKLGPPPSSAAAVADLIALAMLLAGAPKLYPVERAQAPGEAPPPNSAAAVAAALDAELRLPAFGRPPQRRAVAHRPEIDRAIQSYLRGRTERPMAASAALWGPAMEASDPSVPEELLSLYLKLKPERRPERVLGVDLEATTEEVTQAYAKRTELVSSMAAQATSAHAAARAAELLDAFDAAFEKILGVGRPSVPPERAPAAHEPLEDEVLIGSERPPPAGAPPAPETQDTQAVSARITALLKQSDWPAVLQALDEWPRDKTLPFVLQLARAMAQREVARQPRVQPWALLCALLAGLICGWLAAQIGGL